MNKFIFTCGDVNGIGLEIIIKTLNKKAVNTNNSFTVITPGNAFHKTIELIKPEFDFTISSDYNKNNNSSVNIIDIGNIKISTGRNTAEAGEAAYKAIKLSFDLLQSNRGDAVITAPISKAAIKMAGINFPGHTEMYASWCGVKKYVMMFLSKRMNAALLTIHEPLSKVPKLVTEEKIRNTLSVIHNVLKSYLRIDQPRIAVLGLNPHAGESGILGLEEENIIIPAINKIDFAEGPFPPDAFFGKKLYENYNCVLGMYHDQVLIPFKMMNFSAGVNYTAGLPIIRTSPDHGTAFDIAGKGIADESSILEALFYANKFVRSSKQILNGKI